MDLKTRWVYCLLMLALVLTACSVPQSQTQSGVPTSKPTDNPNTPYNESIVPGEGQPPFVTFGQTWILDPNGDCRFRKDTVQWADQVIEELRVKWDIWMAILCQPGIKNLSPMNNERMYGVDFMRWSNLGSAENDWAILIIFRPDVTDKENRVVLERTYGLTWYSPVVYREILLEAAKYANNDDFDGALQSIIRNNVQLSESTMDRKNPEVDPRKP